MAGKRYFPGCEYWTCKHEMRNILFLNDTYPLIGVNSPSNPSNLNWFLAHSDAFDRNDTGRGFDVSEDVTDGSGNYRRSREDDPTKMGLDQGECLVYVPSDSTMSGAGKNGADIGANLLYRYENGSRTSEPLWDPQTGEFPCGARISGSPNDVAGKSCYDVHERLNANTNGCQLPYDAIRLDVEAKPTSGPTPLTVEFSASARKGKSPYEYEWTFGDGSESSVAREPSHTYSSPGSYTAEVTVTDADGETGSAQRTIDARDVEIAEAPKTPDAVTIDGDLSDPHWSDASNVQIDADSDGGGNSVSARSLWDEDHLYLGVEVTDMSFDVDPNANPWERDGIEMFFDPERDRGASLDSDDFKWIAVADGELLFAQTDDQGWDPVSESPEIDHAVARTNDGYRIEIAMSWTEAAVTPAEGRELGLQIINNDRDDGAVHRPTWDGDAPTASPRDWGLLKLVAGGNSAPGDAGGGDVRADTDAGREGGPDGGIADDIESGADSGTNGRGSAGCMCTTGDDSAPPSRAVFLLLMVALLDVRRRRTRTA